MARSCCCPRRTPTCSPRAQSGADYRLANPARTAAGELPALAGGRRPGRRADPRRRPRRGATGWTRCARPALPRGGAGRRAGPRRRADGAVDGARGVAAEAHRYLAEGGPANLGQLHAFLSDTVLLTGQGFEPPASCRRGGFARARATRQPRRRGRAGRRPLLPGPPASGNTAFVDALLHARSRTPAAAALPVFCAVAAPAPEPSSCDDARRTRTPWSSPCSRPAAPSPPARQRRRRRRGLGRRRARRARRPDPAGPLPDQQPRRVGRPATTGCRRSTSATQVAIPEFDGRIITVPFSFKEVDADGLPCYVADPERCRPGGRASPCGTPGCATSPPRASGSRSMLSAYPTKHARIGNAVGLDTPACAVRLLRAMRRGRVRRRRRACPAWPTQRRRRADPRADRGRRPGRGVAHRGAAAGQPGADRRGPLPRLVRRPARGPAGAVDRALGPGAGRAVRRRRPEASIVARRAARRQRAC